MKKFDAIIIGGGPAGISAALWCSDLGLKAVLIEKDTALGGQLCQIYNPVINYLGLSAANGEELRKRFVESLKDRKFELNTRSEVVAADLEGRTVTLKDGSTYLAGSIIIATGVRRRKLGVPGEEEFAGKGILKSGAKEAEKVKGKRVVIIGGGDAALENAWVLSDHANSVTVVHRRNEFAARKSFVDAAREKANVQFLIESIVTGFRGVDLLERIEILDKSTSLKSELPSDFALIRIGVEPNSELFRDQLETDDKRYILTNRSCETSCEKVYAIGDVCNPRSLTISTASGNAATAVLHMLSCLSLK